jgi:hypothetical protein
MALSPHLALVGEIRAVSHLRHGSRIVTVFDVERVDPSLTTGEERDDESHLHDLSVAELAVELLPHGVVG